MNDNNTTDRTADHGDTIVKRGYVEEAIKEYKEKVWDAYLSIDVKPKTGYEEIPAELKEYLNNTKHYMALKTFFEQNDLREAILTDDIIPLDDKYDLYSVIRAIIGKNILIHLRVNVDRVQEVNDHLEAAAEMEVKDIGCLIEWQCSDNDYIAELKKRLPDWSEYIVRLYEDGNGVIIYNANYKTITTYYFRIKEPLRTQLVKAIYAKMHFIIHHPRRSTEDDRSQLPVHMRYNINRRYPDAEKRLKANPKYEFTCYEDTDYDNDENKIDIAKKLIQAPEIKDKWMKMHLE